MRSMIARFDITRVWLMETELWPSLLWVCMSSGIPVCMANARMEQRSFRTYRRFGFLFRPLLSYLQAVLVQDESYAQRFRDLGVAGERIAVTGNIKSRVVVQRPAYEAWSRLRREMNVDEGCTVITAGCIHGGEAAALRDAIEIIGREFPLWRWIIVPRHLKDVPELLDVLGPGAVHVKEPRVTRDWRVCLVARYGIMEDMYRVADVAVVGGTFVDVGGHNVWEAAQFGIPVLWGPNYHTQRESCNRLLEAGVGFSVASGAELSRALVRILKTEARTFIQAEVAFVKKNAESAHILEHAIP